MISLNEGEYELTVKRSRFIAISRSVSSRDEVKAFAAELKRKHYEARHVCYGFVLANGDFGYDDDGEPSGTAGKPIYSAIAAAGLNGCAIAVVRYFGGILLGAGGLTHAYRDAAAGLIESAGTTELFPYDTYTVTASGEVYKKILPILRKNECILREILYNECVTASVLAPSGRDVSSAIAPLGAQAEKHDEIYLTQSEIDHGSKSY